MYILEGWQMSLAYHFIIIIVNIDLTLKTKSHEICKQTRTILLKINWSTTKAESCCFQNWFQICEYITNIDFKIIIKDFEFEIFA